jgi:hypothetical protein
MRRPFDPARHVGLASDYAGDLAWLDAAPVSPGRSAMSHFVPPYPDRPREPLPPLAMLRTVRRNFLAAFDDKCFEYQLFTVQILQQPGHRGAGFYRQA